jgi:hypothetical protein
MNTGLLKIALLPLMLSSCTNTGPNSFTFEFPRDNSFRVPPPEIVTNRAGFIPEGIDFDNINNRFLTGSLADGTVYEITYDGRLIPAFTSPDLISSVGIEVDEPRNRLLVSNSDMNSPNGAAMLGVYELDSGSQLAMIDLTASIPGKPADSNHFANDVAVSDTGVAFVTDSSQSIVYRIDSNYNASVLINFGSETEIGLNGLEYHSGGYLILVSPSTGQLIKVPVANPDNWSVVELDFPASGGDGLVWASDGTLASISNNSSSVSKYRSDDNWATARLVAMASFQGQATTGAAVGDSIYVVQPHFGDDEPPVILRAEF